MKRKLAWLLLVAMLLPIVQVKAGEVNVGSTSRERWDDVSTDISANLSGYFTTDDIKRVTIKFSKTNSKINLDVPKLLTDKDGTIESMNFPLYSANNVSIPCIVYMIGNPTANNRIECTDGEMLVWSGSTTLSQLIYNDVQVWQAIFSSELFNTQRKFSRLVFARGTDLSWHVTNDTAQIHFQKFLSRLTKEDLINVFCKIGDTSEIDYDVLFTYTSDNITAIANGEMYKKKLESIHDNYRQLFEFMYWYYTKDIGFKFVSNDLPIKNDKDTDVLKFIKNVLSEDTVDKVLADQTNKDTVTQNTSNATSIGLDPSKVEDWFTYAVALQNGVTLSAVDAKFNDMSNFPGNKKEQVQVKTVLNLPNSAYKKDTISGAALTDREITKAFARTSSSSSISAEVEAIETSLNNIKTLGEEDYNDWSTRMITFKDRVQYLAIIATKKNANIDDSVTYYYNNPLSSYLVTTSMPAVTFGYSSLCDGTLTFKNADAYTQLVATITELPIMALVAVPTLENALKDNTISQLTAYVNGLISIREALNLIDMPEAEVIWLENFQDIYEKLQDADLMGGLDATTTFDSTTPMYQFFELSSEKLSSAYLKGIAYSAQFIPMNTNMYDAYTLSQFEDDFLKGFHYKYGFHRKALYIDTNDSSAVDLHNTNRVGKLSVCTLKDLLVPDRDIVLYIDDNFYNVRDLAEIVDKSFDRLDNVNAETDVRPWYQKIWSSVTDFFTVDIYEQTKTAEETKYSKKLRKKISNTKDSSFTSTGTNEDQYVLPSDLITDYIDGVTESDESEAGSNELKPVVTYDAYTPLQGYAVVSSIYRDKDLYQKAQKVSTQTPVFVSSPDLISVPNTSPTEKATILNYILLKNLEANIPVGYNYNIDMNCPVYMDIYGNILTESGVVVVPAACNMTLFDSYYFKDLYNIGLFTVYGDSYSLPIDYEGAEYIMKYSFEKDEDSGTWTVLGREISGTYTDFARIATGDKQVSAAIQSMFEYDLQDSVKLYNFDKYVNICLEVLRGAPLENIDKDFEGLNTAGRVSKNGLVLAAKFEEFEDSLRSGDSNTILSIPNLAFLSGIEYVVLFAFKILVFVMLIILMVTVYLDAVGQTLSFRTLGKCIWVLILTIAVIMTVPVVFDITYYQSNRLLLQDETAYIAMLNLEKQQSGVEVGVTEVKVPDINTKLLIKLDNFNVPWYDLFSTVMFDGTVESVKELYSTELDALPISAQEDIVVINDGVYMTTNQLFSSADVNVDLDTKNLYMRTDKTLSASYYSPYYAILETLIYRVNLYNQENNWYAFNTKMHKGGKLKTVGLISQYLKSTEFMESEGDILEMLTLHGFEQSLSLGSVFTDTDLKQMEWSLWTQPKVNYDQCEKRANLVSDYAREFVAKNKDLLGKISDETFLKVMALSIAMYHNKVFNVQAADCYEIYNLSNDDILRLSVAPKEKVMSTSTLTFGRFVYEVGRGPAVVAAIILEAVLWISSYVKPLCTLLVFISIFASIFIFKIVLRKESSNLYGYIITTLLLCATNVLHSILLKFCLNMPNLGLSPTVCMLLQVVLQGSYMAVLIWVAFFSIREWRDLGFDKVQSKVQQVTSKYVKGDNRYTSRSLAKRNHNQNHWDYYNNLVDDYNKRNRW